MQRLILSHLISFFLVLMLGCSGNNNPNPAITNDVQELVKYNSSHLQNNLLPTHPINNSVVAIPQILPLQTDPISVSSNQSTIEEYAPATSNIMTVGEQNTALGGLSPEIWENTSLTHLFMS